MHRTRVPVRAGISRLAGLVLPLLGAALGACGADTTAPPAIDAAEVAVEPTLADEVRLLTAQRAIGALHRPKPVRAELVRLGQMLSFDKELSGNRDIACMTCHLPGMGTGDARSLSIGQGGSGLGTARTHPDGIFIPRNAPPAFNLTTLTTFFWDGRVEAVNGRVHTPAVHRITPEMERVFEFGALSALPLFPVMNRAEMRGDGGNELASARDDNPQQVWRNLMRRLGAIPEYRQLFESAYPGTQFRQMTFAHASNAIAGFLVDQVAFNDSPWDRFLAGDDAALDEAELRGARSFMIGRCSICHNGAALSDNAFHNVAVAQIGPGVGDGAGGFDDFGRMRVTGNPQDRYAFRTPPLRNVELTAPYGHNGSIVDLREFVAHYSESDLRLRAYDPNQLEPLLRGTVQPTFEAIIATRDTLLNRPVLTDQRIDDLTAYMKALTDPRARDLDALIPARVPSGLPVDR
jgi:cytochrome c peroxidase